jgi:hypothetical protein
MIVDLAHFVGFRHHQVLRHGLAGPPRPPPTAAVPAGLIARQPEYRECRSTRERYTVIRFPVGGDNDGRIHSSTENVGSTI